MANKDYSGRTVCWALTFTTVSDNISPSGIIERRNSLTSHEEDIFLRVFDQLVNDLQADPKFADIQDMAEWLRKILSYNVPDGKQIR